MRPLRLELEGFSTFRDRTVIDLADRDLFAFVGPTGAGKSSIIDALTFALYGSVARLDRKVVAPVINQLSTQARVRLDFAIGGRHYCATRVVRRTKSGATTKEARLECGDEILAGSRAEMNEAVEALLHLDFGQFNKTVVLPQGKFSAFLHDEPAGRRELLRRLLDTGIYERIRVAAAETTRDAESKAELLRQQLAGSTATPEHAAELEAEAQSRRTAQADVERLAATATTIATDVVRLEDAVSQRADELARLEAVVIPEDVGALDDPRRAATAELAVATSELEAARTVRDAATHALELGPDEATARAALDAHHTLSAERERLDAAELDASAGEARLADALAALASIEAELVALAASAAAMHRALDSAEHAVANSPSADGLRRALDDHATLADLRARRAVAAKARDGAREMLDAAEQAADDARAASADARVRLDVARRADGTAAHRAHLVLGEPCPVCDQTVDEVPEHAPATVAPAATAALEAAERVVTERDEAVRAAHRSHTGSETEERAIATQIETLSARLSAVDDANSIRIQLEKVATQAATLVQARAAATDAEQQHRATMEAAATLAAREQVARDERDVSAAGARRDDARSRVETLVAVVEGSPSAAELETQITSARSLTAARAEAFDAVGAAEQREAAARAAIATNDGREADLRHDFVRTRDALSDLSPPAPDGASLRQDYEQLVSWARERIPPTRDERAKHTEELAARRIEGSEIEADLAARARPLVGEVALGELIAAVGSRVAEAEAKATRGAEDLAASRQLTEQLQDLETQAQVGTVLKGLLRTDRFESWLLEGWVDGLAQRASQRMLSLSAGRYSLVAHNTMFRVVDHANADEERDARTLSGGETFLASLALALSLADMIGDSGADDAPTMESLFIDEGFGALDPETLDVVAAALEELGSEGRMVGVVTHIRELADRLPARYDVARGPTTSTVTIES